MSASEIDLACINTIRTLSMDAVQQANSGHPGAPMGLAPAAYVLFTRVMKHNPKDPLWADRDRFVLSNGHASMLLYSVLHLCGYDLSLDDIKNFRQWGSKTPGHPEYGHTPGVETTTGPLGQGFANAVGMAMAERFLASRFNRPGHPVVNHNTYAMVGDGCLMEGITAEAASLAGHLGLSRLIVLYDDNKISIEGSTDLTFTEDVAARFEAYRWQVIKVEDGTDIEAIAKAIESAQEEKDKPSLICIRTNIAHGSPGKQGSADAHGAPLGKDEVKKTKAALGCNADECFFIPKEVYSHFAEVAPKGQAAQKQWENSLAAYKAAHPEIAADYFHLLKGLLPQDWDSLVPDFAEEKGSIATRAASGKVLNALAQKIPYLMGGSADLAPSNNTLIKGEGDFAPLQYGNRNIRFGVREHAMGAIISGMALHKGIIPYAGTFLVFADYMRPAIRVASLMQAKVIYVFTHDSIAVGEDGPTHQPVEHLASLRIIPGLKVLRPADATETAEAWKLAITSSGPVALLFSRQNLPVIDRTKTAPAKNVEKGGYVLADCQGAPQVILMGSGAEVHLALAAQKILAEKGIMARVVSMPSWEIFEAQDKAYQESVLPPKVRARVSVEAGSTMGWEKYIGENGVAIGINRFGASAPGNIVLEKMGFTAEKVVDAAKTAMAKSS